MLENMYLWFDQKTLNIKTCLVINLSSNCIAIFKNFKFVYIYSL